MKLPLSVSHGFQQKSPINELLMINQILLANNGVHNDHTTDELITWEKKFVFNCRLYCQQQAYMYMFLYQPCP